MRIVRILAAVAAVTSMLAGCASAASSSQDACASPAEPWRDARALAAVREPVELTSANFATGEAVRFQLHPDGEVTYLTLPRGEGEASSFGGLAAFTVERAGNYRVGLSEPLWVDVARGGKPAETVRFGPGPACSGLRKIVVFRLEPGEHVLEMSGGTEAGVSVVVEPAGE